MPEIEYNRAVNRKAVNSIVTRLVVQLLRPVVSGGV